MSKRSLAAAAATATLALSLLTACGSSAPTASAPASGACTYNAGGAASKVVKTPSSTPASATHATLTTNHGSIGITLDPKDTPCTVNSFVSLAKQGYFDSTPCHRLTTSGIYVLQCGDPSGTGSGGPGYEFNDELPAAARPKSCDASGTCIYPAGTVAMANAGPNTNGSQFFLVYKDSPLPYNYAIFGTMSAAGIQTVQTIAAKGSNNSNGAGDGAPNEAVTIQTATVN